MTKIHPTAIVEQGAQLDHDVEVGAYAMVGAHVKIGANTVLQPHSYVTGHTTIGKQCEIFPYACLGGKTQDLKYQAGDVTYVEIGDHNVFREFCTVNSGTKPGEITRIASHCLIMAYCHIAHGCVLGNHVIMANQATLAGEVIIDDFAVIGGMTGIHQFCRIGTYAMIAGASRIRKDCPPYMLVEGYLDTPRVLSPNIVGLQRRGINSETRSALKEAHKLLYREGLNRLQAIERIRNEVADLPEIRHLIEFYQNSQRGVL